MRYAFVFFFRLVDSAVSGGSDRCVFLNDTESYHVLNLHGCPHSPLFAVTCLGHVHRTPAVFVCCAGCMYNRTGVRLLCVSVLVSFHGGYMLFPPQVVVFSGVD